MSKKSAKIAGIIERFQEETFDAHYLAYFDCFNQQLFYEAHDVLEEMWLPQKKEAKGAFYKGLIQLAGAFVHLQKQRLKPSAALFRLADANLRQYPSSYEGLDVAAVWRLIEQWLGELEQNKFERNPLTERNLPRLVLPSGPIKMIS